MMLRRIGLFLLTNMLVVATISIIINVLGIAPYLSAARMNYASLAVFCLFWGMAGSIIALLMSKTTAKYAMGVELIDPRSHGELRWVLETTHRLARAAGITTMPEVGVYRSPEVNAFATGPTKNNALVAVSTGLLQQMSRDEVEGVLGHEVAHIQNGDMVTMTLIQGVVNAFTMFLARVIAMALSRGSDDRERSSTGYFFTVMVLEMVFGALGMLVVAWFSRQREFRADAGSAKLLGGRTKMVSALEALNRMFGRGERRSSNEDYSDDRAPALAALKISNARSRGQFLALFSTHPPLERRIAALQRAAL